MTSQNNDVAETSKKNMVKKKSEGKKKEKNDVVAVSDSKVKSGKEEKQVKSATMNQKKNEEKNSHGEAIDEINAVGINNAVHVNSIINSDELFADHSEQCKTENYQNERIVKDKTNKDINNNSIEVPAENVVGTASYIHGENTTEVQKTTKISNNAELVIEPVKFKDKLNMWKGTINSIKIRKEDEKKQEERRLKQLENVKLAHNLKKEEELLQKEYLEQLKKDEELAKKIEQELNEEVKNELHKIEESDFQLAQRLQSTQEIQDENSAKKICSKTSIHNNANNSNNSTLSVSDPPSKAQQLKDKFRSIFKKKKKNSS